MKKTKTDISYIGENIRRIRYVKGWTNRHFAQKLGVSEQLSAFYQRRCVADFRILNKIAEVLEVDLSEILEMKK